MTQEDQTERGLSSFASEIEDTKIMLQSPYRHILTLFDEFSNRYPTGNNNHIIAHQLNVDYPCRGHFLNIYHHYLYYNRNMLHTRHFHKTPSNQFLHQ